MKCWQSKSDMAEMSITILESLPTSVAHASLAGYSLDKIVVSAKRNSILP